MVFRAQLPASPAMGAGEEANRGKKILPSHPPLYWMWRWCVSHTSIKQTKGKPWKEHIFSLFQKMHYLLSASPDSTLERGRERKSAGVLNYRVKDWDC